MHSNSYISQRSAMSASRQRGVTLIELMVGLAVGLLVVAVAMGAVIASRSVSGTVSDVSSLQQQGAFVLRVVGLQLRQAGSLYLNPDPAGGGRERDVDSDVAFEMEATGEGTGNSFTQGATLKGGDSTLTTGFRRYADAVFKVKGVAATESGPAISGIDFLARNCVGRPANSSTDQLVESIFTLADNNLRCGGNGGTAEPMAQNVAQFQLSYLVQDTSGTALQYVKGSDMPVAGDAIWRRVRGVQVCLVLYGSESIEMPEGSSYTDCNGDSVDITALADANAHRKNRMHLLFRNTFQLRSYGLL